MTPAPPLLPASLPPFLASLPPAVSPASVLQRPPSPLAQALVSPLSRHGLSSPPPTHFSCLPLLPESCHSSKGPSMLEPSDICTGHSLSLACSSPTCPHGSLLHHLQVFTHLPPVFTPTHTSYPPFPLFLLSIYHKHVLHRISAPGEQRLFKCLYP